MSSRIPGKVLIGISLGWNCVAAMHGVEKNIRRARAGGYKTCPFDECISSYNGVVKCIRDGFEDFTNTEHLELIKGPSPAGTGGESLIYNKKYNIIFNHESPGHADLYKTQKWPGGIDHFVANSFAEFKSRYNARVQNIKYYLGLGLDPHHHIVFIITKENDDFTELKEALNESYPGLSYDILYLPIDDVYFNIESKTIMGLTREHGILI
jgi:hypothetical protein